MSVYVKTSSSAENLTNYSKTIYCSGWNATANGCDSSGSFDLVGYATRSDFSGLKVGDMVAIYNTTQITNGLNYASVKLQYNNQTGNYLTDSISLSNITSAPAASVLLFIYTSSVLWYLG